MLRPGAIAVICPDCRKNYETHKDDKKHTCPYCQYTINAELEREKQAAKERKQHLNKEG